MTTGDDLELRALGPGELDELLAAFKIAKALASELRAEFGRHGLAQDVVTVAPSLCATAPNRAATSSSNASNAR